MRSLQNTKGFTLVEILVGVGLVGIVLIAIFGLQSGLLKSQNSSMNSMEVTDLRYEVSGILSNDARCSAALVGKTSSEGVEIDIAPNIKAGAKYGKLLLSVVRLSEVRDLGNNKRTANVQMIGTKTGANALSNTFNELVPVYYWVNSAGTIVTCKDNSSVCTSLGGIWKSDHCDFCANLGGTLQADNTCRTN